MKAILKKTLYAQFCAGETPEEVRATVQKLKGWGVGGILLGWAREVEKRGETWEDGAQAEKQAQTSTDIEPDFREMREWADAALETVKIAGDGDYVSLKYV